MSNASSRSTCQIASAVAAVLVGLIVFLSTRGAIPAIAALLVGVGLGVILHVVLSRLFCVQAPRAAARPVAAAPAEPEPVAAAQRDAKAADGTAPEPASPPAAPGADAMRADTGGGDAAGGDVARGDVAKAAAVAFGTQLPGEEELRARKGEWRYEGGTPEAEADAEAARGEGRRPEPPDQSDEGRRPEPPDQSGEGRRPEPLAGPREGGPDDLRLIKGIGPRIQEMLYSMGIYHFDQIAALSPEEIIWLDANLKGFRGRISRDRWVEQARILAEGGETEFSRRARDGDVY